MSCSVRCSSRSNRSFIIHKLAGPAAVGKADNGFAGRIFRMRTMGDDVVAQACSLSVLLEIDARRDNFS